MWCWKSLRITMIGHLQMYIENHRGVLHFSEKELRLLLTNGQLLVTGEQLVIRVILPEEILLEAHRRRQVSGETLGNVPRQYLESGDGHMRNGLQEWLDGYITITVRGKRFERMLNMAVREGIRIWNIRRVGQEVGRCDILIRVITFACGRFCGRQAVALTWNDEAGCLSGWSGCAGGPVLVIGASLFLVGMYMLSSFVWQVEVQGVRQMRPEAVTNAAAQVGIKEGVWKAKLKESHVLQRELMSLLPEASRAIVDIQGTKAIIQVVEKEEPEKPAPPSPRHLVAKKRAVVHTILPEAGKSMVSVNQFVEKGQTLISGIIGNETRQKAVAARGTVKGEVWYVSNVTMPLAQVHYQLTGERQQTHYLLVGPFAVQIWPFKQQPFAQAESVDSASNPRMRALQVRSAGRRSRRRRRSQSGGN